MRRLFEEFSKTKKPLQSKSNTALEFIFIKNDVLQFKVIIFHRSPIKFSLQKETNGDNQKTLLLVTVKCSYRWKIYR